MLNPQRIAITLLLFTGLIGMQSCVKGLAVARITEEKGAIPPDFGKDSSILVCVLEGKKRIDKYTIRDFEEYYHGKYVFALPAELNDGTYSNGNYDFVVTPADRRDSTKYSDKYSDVVKYRFVFEMETESYSYGTNSYITAKLFMRDRKDNKIYRSPVTSSFYSKLIKAYLTNLEKKRLESQR